MATPEEEHDAERETYERLKAQLEPASDGYIQTSAAISLKRIADALEAQNKVFTDEMERQAKARQGYT